MKNNNLILSVKPFIVSCVITFGIMVLISGCSNNENPSQRNNELIAADNTMEQAYTLYEQAQFDKSIDLSRKAMEVYRENNDSLSMSDVYSHLSACYQRMSMNDSALSNSFAGLRIEEMLKNNECLSSTYNNLAAIYLSAERPKEARTFIEKAINIEESLKRKDKGKLSTRYGIAAEVYLKLKDNKKALDYINKAYVLDTLAHDTIHAARRLAVMGDIFSAKNDLPQALECYNQAIEFMQITGDKYSLMLTHKSLGSLYDKQGQKTNALMNLEKSITLAQECKAKRVLQQNYLMLANSLSSSAPQRAIDYLLKSNELKDSIYNDATSDLTSHYAMEFESQQKQLTIEEQQHSITTQRIIIIAVSIILLLLLVGCVALFFINLLRAKAQRAEKNAEQMKDLFFTNVTHEFRTPLTVILGETETLKSNDSKPDNQSRYNSIINQGNHLLDLVNQLLNISKVRSSIGQQQWQHGNVATMVKMIAENMTIHAQEQNKSIEIYCDDEDYNVDFVPEYYQTIVGNLLSNSLKFMSEGGKVVLKMSRSKDKVILSIADDGCGIKSKDLPHIFDLFYQGSTEKSDLGTGIGLSLVKQMTESMNGSIEVSSIEGQGSTFVVTIPVQHKNGGYPNWVPRVLTKSVSPNDEFETELSDEEFDDTTSDKPIALVVEDNVDVATYIKHVLEQKFCVLQAFDGIDGLNMARETVPDIIVSDVMMPGIDGYELCRRVRADELINHVPIIIVTARSEDKDRLVGLEVGADAYLVKPFNSNELIALAGNLLHSREMLKLKYQAQLQLSTDIEDPSKVKTDNEDNATCIITERNNIFMEKLRGIIVENISNPEMNSTFLADKMNLSQRQLNRKVKSVTAIDTASYIRQMRIATAQSMLVNTDDPVSEIAINCGFDSSSYFSKIFKQCTQLTPSDFRKQHSHD